MERVRLNTNKNTIGKKKLPMKWPNETNYKFPIDLCNVKPCLYRTKFVLEVTNNKKHKGFNKEAYSYLGLNIVQPNAKPNEP